jgi:hypothetical protein
MGSATVTVTDAQQQQYQDEGFFVIQTSAGTGSGLLTALQRLCGARTDG